MESQPRLARSQGQPRTCQVPMKMQPHLTYQTFSALTVGAANFAPPSSTTSTIKSTNPKFMIPLSEPHTGRIATNPRPFARGLNREDSVGMIDAAK
jgi:hypothetical protein